MAAKLPLNKINWWKVKTIDYNIIKWHEEKNGVYCPIGYIEHMGNCIDVDKYQIVSIFVNDPWLVNIINHVEEIIEREPH